MKHRIIAFTGSGMGAGKTTAANFFDERLEFYDYRPVKVKFAGPIYDIVFNATKRTYTVFDKAKLRGLMQFIGSYYRQEYDENFWVNIWERDVKKELGRTYKTIVLSDDVRFDNEAEKVISLGGIIIKIEAPKELREKRIELVNTNHESERGINEKYIYSTIYNNGSILDLRKNLDYVFEILRSNNK